jgi:cellulase
MDIWEANGMSTALTPHTCSQPGAFTCHGDECGKGDTGVCDKAGCGINPYRTVSKDFYGRSKTVDTLKPFTVVTQFLTADNTTSTPLTTIKRLYIQDGHVIEVPSGGRDEIDQAYCTTSGPAAFNRLGGLEGSGASLARGMVLAFSIWDSPGDFMQWLDSGSAGPCGPTDGDPAKILAENPNVAVTWSNIRWGEIGSTF